MLNRYKKTAGVRLYALKNTGRQSGLQILLKRFPEYRKKTTKVNVASDSFQSDLRHFRMKAYIGSQKDKKAQ